MSYVDLKKYASDSLNGAATRYVQDLEAMSDEQCCSKPNGVGRAALDYTYEVAFVNRMIAARLRGEEPPAWPWNETWATAPEGYTKAQAVEDLKGSVAELTQAMAGMDDEKFRTQVELPDGRFASPYERINFASMHMMYHDAQLNYCQAMNGDLEMHWN